MTPRGPVWVSTVRALVLMAVVILTPLAAAAQVAMPDASSMAGTPLPAPELPDGTVTVRVLRERLGNNVGGQVVSLRVGGANRTATTDDQGRAQFDSLPAGALTQATVTVDGEVLTSEEFPAPARGGVRVALIAGLAKAAAAEQAAAAAAAREPARPGIVEFGPDSRIILEFQDDTLTLFYLLDIVNNARTPIDIGGPLIVELPTGASGASMLQGSAPQASVLGDRMTVTGPFPPGTTQAQVGFVLPNAGADLVLTQVWPAAAPQILVAAEKVGAMQMTSSQLNGIRDVQTEGGIFVMGTSGRLNAGDTLTVTLTGMPAPDHTARDVTVAIVLLVLGVGAWLAFTPTASRTARDGQLRASREKLLGDIVSLERKRAGKGLSEADEARRQRLTAELERVLASLDDAPSPRDEAAGA